MPSPVITFTANPLAETTLEFSAAVTLGDTHRAATSRFQVGGKGFNVAKMLHRLGVPVTALSFAGGTSGEACRQWLAAHAAYDWQLLPMTAATRIGTVVQTPLQPETTFLGPDCKIDRAAAVAASRAVHATPSDAIVALCGSLPGWSEDTFSPLRQAFLQTLPGDRLVVDTYGPALADLVQRPLALVKINRTELRSLAGTLGLQPELDSIATTLPVHTWVVTDGPNPIQFRSGAGAGDITPPTVREVSATGSGDVFLATMLAGNWRDPIALPALLRRAADFAARNAAEPGIAEFELPA